MSGSARDNRPRILNNRGGNSLITIIFQKGVGPPGLGEELALSTLF